MEVLLLKDKPVTILLLVSDMDIFIHRLADDLPQAFFSAINTLCHRQISDLLQSCMTGLPQDSHMFVN